ncbi:MAG: hypothetical protein AAFN77_02275 [Planctomycetota bacterium]
MNASLLMIAILFGGVVIEPTVRSVDPIKESEHDVDDLSKPPSIQSIEATFDRIHWNNFVDQVVRANRLRLIANQIDPWVHSTRMDELVEDFESSLMAISFAESLLQAELEAYGSPRGSTFGFQVDLIDRAKRQLDAAEFSLDMLTAMAYTDI